MPDTNEAILLQVTQLLGQLTARVTEQPIPEPVPFTRGAGRTLNDFFKEFEAHAGKTFGTDKALWTPRLSKYLDEPLLSLYNSLVQLNQGYEEVKKALENSFGEADTLTPADLLDRFNSTEYDPQEGIKGLISRLSALATRAYTGAPQGTLDELVRRRCVSALPATLSTPLNFWLLSNPQADLQELMRVGAGLERSLPPVEVATVATPPEITPPVPARRRRDTLPVGEQAAALPLPPPTSLGSRPTQSLFCQYCRKPGHEVHSCRTRTRRCFSCGGQGHFLAECPRGPTRSNPNNPRPLPRRPIPSNAPVPRFASPPLAPVTGANAIPSTCAFCGEAGHAMARCPHFEGYLENIVDRRLNR